ncbi:hypothetical protein HZH66_009345 [Vespula vulgaris]|uniref:Uncharacterized protein n=1 Tax=Vespula vulgaris TaxID=7454 RepID=A0A834JMT4_VESVU|nr:hypothetical protein HZH66_009345 [Vespula vulgaris]
MKVEILINRISCDNFCENLDGIAFKEEEEEEEEEEAEEENKEKEREGDRETLGTISPENVYDRTAHCKTSVS